GLGRGARRHGVAVPALLRAHPAHRARLRGGRGPHDPRVGAAPPAGLDLGARRRPRRLGRGPRPAHLGRAAGSRPAGRVRRHRRDEAGALAAHGQPVRRKVDLMTDNSTDGLNQGVPLGTVAPRTRGGPVRLDDKVAVVTGAASGIGRATARTLAAAGATIAAADRDADGLTELVAEIGGGTTGHRVDLADKEEIRTLRDDVVAAHGLPHVIVNAAGFDRAEPFMQNDDELWEQLAAVNFL